LLKKQESLRFKPSNGWAKISLFIAGQALWMVGQPLIKCAPGWWQEEQMFRVIVKEPLAASAWVSKHRFEALQPPLRVQY